MERPSYIPATEWLSSDYLLYGKPPAKPKPLTHRKTYSDKQKALLLDMADNGGRISADEIGKGKKHSANTATCLCSRSGSTFYPLLNACKEGGKWVKRGRYEYQETARYTRSTNAVGRRLK
jgi:hypothetical protein